MYFICITISLNNQFEVVVPLRFYKVCIFKCLYYVCYPRYAKLSLLLRKAIDLSSIIWFIYIRQVEFPSVVVFVEYPLRGIVWQSRNGGRPLDAHTMPLQKCPDTVIKKLFNSQNLLTLYLPSAADGDVKGKILGKLRCTSFLLCLYS